MSDIGDVFEQATAASEMQKTAEQSKAIALASRGLVDAISQSDLKALIACGDTNAARACLRRVLRKVMEKGTASDQSA